MLRPMARVALLPRCRDSGRGGGGGGRRHVLFLPPINSCNVPEAQKQAPCLSGPRLRPPLRAARVHDASVGVRCEPHEEGGVVAAARAACHCLGEGVEGVEVGQRAAPPAAAAALELLQRCPGRWRVRLRRQVGAR